MVDQVFTINQGVTLETGILPSKPEPFITNTNNHTLEQRMRQLIRQSWVYLNHAPKSEKYGLALQIKNLTLDMHKKLIECLHKYIKKTSLRELDVLLQQLRELWYLYYDLGFLRYKTRLEDSSQSVADHRYSVIGIYINECGRMIGGWIKAENAQHDAKVKSLQSQS